MWSWLRSRRFCQRFCQSLCQLSKRSLTHFLWTAHWLIRSLAKRMSLKMLYRSESSPNRLFRQKRLQLIIISWVSIRKWQFEFLPMWYWISVAKKENDPKWKKFVFLRKEKFSNRRVKPDVCTHWVWVFQFFGYLDLGIANLLQISK